MSEERKITPIKGITIGHYTDLEALTGCTVILCLEGAVAGVDVRGGAPGTRETDLLRPMNLVNQVNAILLAGGSAFGLAAADGVVKFLEEKGYGFETGVAKVPIVPAAIVFDLAIGSSTVRPGAEAGYKACLSASSERQEEGNVGAGTGATVGKALGWQWAMKGGLGLAGSTFPGGLVVNALAVVNAFGDILDENGEILAGVRSPQGGFLGTINFFRTQVFDGKVKFGRGVGESTTLGVIMSNAKMTKEEVNKVAQMGQDGLARAINPVHTMFDGDIVFALSTCEVEAHFGIVGVLGAELIAQAIRGAVRLAKTVGDIPGLA